MEEKKNHKKMAKELDRKVESMSTDEAEFLEEVVGTLADGKKLKPKIALKFEAIYEKYLGEKEEEEEGATDDDDADEEEEIDEDDFQ